MSTEIQTTPALDEETHVTALLVGSGIVLTQAFAIFPGLLPFLLLLLPFVLPLVVVGAVAAIPFLLFRAAWRLLASAAERASQMRAAIRQGSDIETREAIPHGSTTH